MNASLLQAELGCSPLFARLLVARGLSDAASVERFLQPSLERDWLDPALIGGMEAGVARLQLALREGQRIAVFGDYDLDGISATAVMVRGLEALGATELRALLPERSAGGYGLSEQATAAIEASAPDLLVTVDNGITAAAAVARLRAAGIDVIVTDHHLPDPASLPGDAVLIDPQLDSDDLSPLSGAGVALKVIQALSIAEGRPELWKEWTDLATMGTIADIVPLLGENRALVTEGLARLRTHPNPGLRELVASVRNLDLSAITSERVSFSLAPRLNAAGRMGSPRVALDLLLCDDPDNCAALSQRLAQLNGLRRETEAELTAVVTAQVSKSFRPGQRLILAAGEGWHEGVRGIVASRLVDAFGAVAIVCGIEDGMASGSVRSVGSVDVHEALLACSAHLTQFGGHATAAGVTLPAAALEDFGADLAACLDKLPAEQFEPTAAVDLDCRLNELDWALAEEFERLEPFGEGMRKPVLSAAPVEVERAGLVGAGQEHLSFRARQGETSVKAIYFRAVDGERWVGQVTPARVSFTLEKDEFRGARGVQLGVVDLQPWDGGGEEGADGDGSGIRLRGTERSGDGAPKRKSDTVSSDAPSSAAPRPDADEFVLDLFAHADESFARRDYANIADAASFYTKLAGVSFAGRQELISQLLPADQLELRREPDNPHDTCAIAVIATRLRAQIGFLNRALCAELAPAIDEGAQYSAELEQVTGGEEGRSRGVNVLLTRVGADDDRAVSLAAQDSERARLEALPAAELDEALRKLFIGSGTLHAAQAETLDALSRGVNTLTVMATGRGKSLIFHLHAARLAIAQHRQSIFVFPLRALVADQAFHLEEVFARIGLRVQVITGESSEAARTAAFEGLSAHAIDIVLTTPEFLSFHAREFAEAADVGFVVIDEAHHIGQARAGNRPAYTRLGEAIAELGSPTTLAVTATAGPEVATRVCEI
ncbi:MAG: single-stranded-DNA-specific exonuclease RecJ, partial [Actinomycetia bacterium]|nr:single-stranded-DNA-specific exonuclease RecJ [Actinomycetes bacterium]